MLLYLHGFDTAAKFPDTAESDSTMGEEVFHYGIVSSVLYQRLFHWFENFKIL